MLLTEKVFILGVEPYASLIGLKNRAQSLSYPSELDLNELGAHIA